MRQGFQPPVSQLVAHLVGVEDNPALSNVIERNMRTMIHLHFKAARERRLQDRIANAIIFFQGIGLCLCTSSIAVPLPEYFVMQPVMRKVWPSGE